MIYHNIPDSLHNPDIADLIKLCERYVRAKVKMESIQGLEDAMIETAMKAIFGNGIFDVMEELIRRQEPQKPEQEPPEDG